MTTPYASQKPVSTLLIALATAAGAISSPAFAAGENSSQIEEIIVTATKREQRLQDFSGSISVVNQFEGIVSLADIANRVPGLSLLETGPRNPTGIIIRGLRMDEVGSNDFGGDGASVASYVDNIPLQGYFVPPAFSLKDLQQVEVLRGPQGTLYGNASIGGLIRYITAKPDLTEFSVSLGSDLSQTKESDGINYDTELVVNAPLGDSIGLRLLLGKTDNKGFIDNPYLLTGPAEDINDDKTETARLGLRWEPVDEFTLGGSYHYQKSNVDDRQAANKEFTGGEYTASSRYRESMEGELHLVGVDADYRFDWATLTGSLNRYDYETTSVADQTGFLLTIDEILFGNTYYSTYEDFSAFTAGAVDVEKDSAEVRLVSPNEQRLRWLVGGFFSQDDLSVVLVDVVPGFADFMGEDRPLDMDYFATQQELLKENSFYGELAYDVTPELEVVVGARRFRYDDELDVCTAFFPLPDGQEEFPTNCTSGDDVHTGTLGKFSTRYRLNDAQQIYFVASEGYRRGGANVLPIEIEHSRFYEPDTAINYELGTKAALWDGRINMDAALFYIEWSNIQVSSATEEGYGITANAKDARSQGVELVANAQITERWLFSVNYSFTDAELTESVSAINGGSENAHKGDRLPGAPRHQWNMGLDYTQPLNTATLDAGINLSYNSDMYTTLNQEFTNYDRLDGFATASLDVGVSLRNWRFGAFVNNITNTRGVTGKRTSEWHREQGQFAYITRPRTIGLSVDYHY